MPVEAVVAAAAAAVAADIAAVRADMAAILRCVQIIFAGIF